jgi:hypothetical protein
MTKIAANQQFYNRRQLRRADDRLRAERAKWAAGGFEGPAPEMRELGDRIAVDTPDGTEIIFPPATADTNDVGPTGESGVSVVDRERDWRITAGLSVGPPPKKRKRPGWRRGGENSQKLSFNQLALTSRPPQAEFFRAVARAPAQPKSGQPQQWLGLGSGPRMVTQPHHHSTLGRPPGRAP